MSTTILGTLDQGGDGRAVLLAAVNHATGKTFTLADFDFLDPEPVTIPTPTRNTLIRLAPKAHSGWYGTRKVYYNRIHVTELGLISVARGIATTVVGLLPQINEKYGILITELDIYDAPLPAALPGETSVEVDFNFRPTSIIYYGGTKIVLGANDPNAPGGGGSQLPFSGQTTVFAYNTTLNGSGIGSVDISSVTIDADKARKRFAPLNFDSDPPQISDIYRRRVEGQMVATGALPAFPIVDSWKGSTGTFCADGAGLVYKLSADATGWTQHGDMLSLDLAVPATALSCLEAPRVKFVRQGASGSLWALAVVGGVHELMKSTDDGVTWEDQLIVGSNPQSFGPVPSGYTIHDAMVQAGKLWILFTSDVGYPDLATSNTETLGLESVDLTTLNLTRVQLWAATRKNGQGTITPRVQGSRFTLMTPALATVAAPTVVGLIPQTWTTAQLYLFRPETGVPQNHSIYEVRHAPFERDILSRPGTYLQAYATALVKNDQVAIETIEVGSLIESATFNAEQWISDEVRTAQGYFTFGVKVLTRVVQGALANNWVLTSLPMGNGNPAYPLLMVEDGKRMHYALQPESAIHRVRFTEDNTIAGFVPALDSSMTLEKHAGFTHVSRHGVTVWSRPGVSETLNTNYGLVAYANAEAGKPAIEYSFTGVDSNGVVHWLTSPSTATPLAHRSVGIDFAGMSEVPLAVASQGTALLYWSATNGIYSSANAGHAWTRYSEARLGYDASAGLDADLVGRADFAFRPQDFRKGSFLNDISIFELHVAREAKVYDMATGQISASKLLDNRVLFVTDAVIGATANNGFDMVTEYGGYGVNFFDGYSPKAVLHWDTDAANAVTVAAEYTSDPDQPRDEFLDQGILTGADNNMTVRDVRRDVKFLDVDALVWGTVQSGGNTIHRLDWVKTGAVQGSLELFGGSNAPTAGFTPEVAHFLWQNQETNYVPLVYYGGKKVLLVGRLKTDGTFDCTLHNLSVQGDNGSPIVPVPMLTKNRRDYLYAQKGNGIFKLTYQYDSLNKIATFSLDRVFTLTGSAFSDISVLTGAQLSAANAVPPTVPLIPTNPPAGTELSTFCDGTTLKANIADGNGGYTVQDKEVDSVDCGYVPPGPTPVGSNSATITLNTDTSNTSITNTDVIADEGGYAYGIYALDTALNANTTVTFSVVYGTAVAADIQSFAVRAGTTGAWNTVTLPADLVIPAGQTAFGIRIQYATDANIEGDEFFEIVMEKAAGNTQITSDAVVTQFTIEDVASTPPPSGGDVPPSYTPPAAPNGGTQGSVYSDNYITNNKSFPASGELLDYYDYSSETNFVDPQAYDDINGYLTIKQVARGAGGAARSVISALYQLAPVAHPSAMHLFQMNLPLWQSLDAGGALYTNTGTTSVAPAGHTYIEHAMSFLIVDGAFAITPVIAKVSMSVANPAHLQRLDFYVADTDGNGEFTPGTLIESFSGFTVAMGGPMTFEISVQDFRDGKQIGVWLNGTFLGRTYSEQIPAGIDTIVAMDLSGLTGTDTRLRQWEVTGIPALHSWTDLELDTTADPAGLGVTTTTGPVSEGDTINLVYRVQHPLAIDAPQSVWVDIPNEGGVDSSDYENFEYYDYASASWTAYTLGGWIPLVRGQDFVIVRFKAAADGIDEGGEELFKVRMHTRDADGLFPETFFPAPITVEDAAGAPRSTFAVNTTQTPQIGGLMTSMGPVNENTWVTVVYDITDPQTVDNDNSVFAWVVDVGLSNPADGSDIQGWQRWNAGTSAWVSLGFNDLIPIPANSTQIAIRAFVRNDFEPEGAENLTIQLYAQASSGMATDQTVDHTVVINASS